MSVFDVKLVLLGCSACGKSTLLHRLVHGRYRPGLPPTYGAEFGAKRVEVAVPGGGGTNGSEREGRSRGAGRRPSSAADSGGNGGGSGRRGASVGIWDTSGAARFHSQSRRFIAGADAVLVCWDATSRDSWEAMRAWVADARAEDPAVRIYLAACKSDLVLRHNQVAHMEVQVERWPSQEQQQQQARQHSQEEQQQQSAGGT
ncbi:ras-related Rab-24-like [Chlorella sorokiniana]|uniref:Ras-related Rab-24-like n=1 Tax=Chlorella sorokiniana TaxID=3076 RepID=A0A2P6U223_CHLSO|nr:ras-related Rab-24-like [Chlorella sorokiniana]|eukprot:PRW60366.1 ras-related Rab-24-like [Chlorella sorokiniana]